MQDLVTLSTWLESTRPGLTEGQAVAALAGEVGLVHPTGRGENVLRRAVRAATISRSGVDAAESSPEQEPDDTAPDGAAGDLTASEGWGIDPLPTLAAADEAERAQERVREEAEHDAWLEDERPPHH